jgi:hypothetical protein
MIIPHAIEQVDAKNVKYGVTNPKQEAQARAVGTQSGIFGREKPKARKARATPRAVCSLSSFFPISP